MYEEFENSAVFYDIPEEREYDELEPGDIIDIEYGDFEHYVKVVIDTIEIDESRPGTWYRIIGTYLNSGEEFTGYDQFSRCKVIGYIDDYEPFEEY